MRSRGWLESFDSRWTIRYGEQLQRHMIYECCAGIHKLILQGVVLNDRRQIVIVMWFFSLR